MDLSFDTRAQALTFHFALFTMLAKAECGGDDEFQDYLNFHVDWWLAEHGCGDEASDQRLRTASEHAAARLLLDLMGKHMTADGGQWVRNDGGSAMMLEISRMAEVAGVGRLQFYQRELH